MLSATLLFLLTAGALLSFGVTFTDGLAVV